MAKSEALDNIYSLFKQNIKSCNAKRRRQRRRTVKTTIGLNSEKAILHVQHTFFVHFFVPLYIREFKIRRLRTTATDKYTTAHDQNHVTVHFSRVVLRLR